jgi:hypothetical protein
MQGERTNTGDVCGVQRAEHRVLEEPAPRPLALRAARVIIPARGRPPALRSWSRTSPSLLR